MSLACSAPLVLVGQLLPLDSRMTPMNITPHRRVTARRSRCSSG